MAFREKDTNKWSAQWYSEDAKGQKRLHKKRGFSTKKEALEFERQKKLSSARNMAMHMDEFIEVYCEDKKNELKDRTMKNKRYLLNQYIIPYFGKKNMSEITASQIIQWQNEMMNKGFSDAYLRMIQNNLTALFTHASKIYDLKENPMKKVKRMGNSDSRSLDFWTYDEFKQFIKSVAPGSMYHLAFDTLFFTGIRVGEMLALTPADVDLERNQISITKTYYRTNRTDIVTEPKTKQSIRIVEIPEFLKKEFQTFIESHYEMPDDERIFPVVQEAVQHKLKHDVEKSGVKKIRVHDLRHSHVAYLINKGVDPLLIKERLGHKDIQITLNTYGHLYPNKQRTIADLLDDEQNSTPTANPDTVLTPPSKIYNIEELKKTASIK